MKNQNQQTAFIDSANKVTADILKELPNQFTCRFWRRNVGAGYPTSAIRIAVSMLQRGALAEALRHLLHLRPVTFGMPGEPDIDGWVTINGLAIKTGIEVKVGRDKQRETQFDCERVYANGGAIYILGTSVEQVVAELRKQVELRSGVAK